MVKSPTVLARVTGAGNCVGAKRSVVIPVIDGGARPRLAGGPRGDYPYNARRMSRLLLVIPCFNEEKRLDVAAFRDFTGADFLFVNDGSRDGTLRVLESLRDSDPRRFSVLNL